MRLSDMSKAIARALAQRGNMTATEARKAISALDEDTLWNSDIGPMLDRIEDAAISMLHRSATLAKP